MPRLKGYRFPREVVAYAIWAYHRFALSTADVEDLLAERGITVSRETVRKWVNRFGLHFAECIKRDRPTAADKWHLDEVVVPISGVKQWLWRAVDANGDVLDILVQPRRNAKAAKRFLTRLIARFGKPRVVVTDKLRSYIKRSGPSRQKLTIGHTKGSTTASRVRIGRPANERRSWVASNRSDRRKGFSRPTIKSTRCSDPDATASPTSHTATQGPMPSTCGKVMRSK